MENTVLIHMNRLQYDELLQVQEALESAFKRYDARRQGIAEYRAGCEEHLSGSAIETTIATGETF